MTAVNWDLFVIAADYAGVRGAVAARFRVIARKDGPRVRLYSRPGNDLTQHFPLIVEALARLRASSCTIDGEAACSGYNVHFDDRCTAEISVAPLGPGEK
jgi:hypothetical protein